MMAGDVAVRDVRKDEGVVSHLRSVFPARGDTVLHQAGSYLSLVVSYLSLPGSYSSPVPVALANPPGCIYETAGCTNETDYRQSLPVEFSGELVPAAKTHYRACGSQPEL